MYQHVFNGSVCLFRATQSNQNTHYNLYRQDLLQGLIIEGLLDHESLTSVLVTENIVSITTGATVTIYVIHATLDFKGFPHIIFTFCSHCFPVQYSHSM